MLFLEIMPAIACTTQNEAYFPPGKQFYWDEATHSIKNSEITQTIISISKLLDLYI